MNEVTLRRRIAVLVFAAFLSLTGAATAVAAEEAGAYRVQCANSPGKC